MGAFIGEKMGENMRKNMQSQMAFQKQLILKQRQTQMATQIAMGRQRFKYYKWFCATVIPLSIIGAIVKKNPQLAAPVLPLSFIYAFQYDMFYGNMMERVQIEADKLIVQSPLKFYLPQHSGIVSKQQYQQILSIKDGKKVI